VAVIWQDENQIQDSLSVRLAKDVQRFAAYRMAAANDRRFSVLDPQAGRAIRAVAKVHVFPLACSGLLRDNTS